MPQLPKSSYNRRFIESVRATISGNRMLQTGDSVLVAVSGGPDSVALIYCLRELAAEYELKLGIFHLNHCLRQEESDRDADFVGALSRQLSISSHIIKVDVTSYKRTFKLSLEEAGRQVRFKKMEETAVRHGFNKIALGHHADDNAELVLMHLLRGSGTLGLSGIPPVRDKYFIRPLIDIRRSEIINFLEENRLSYITDSSNTDIRFFRNKIRHDLIPYLEKSYNPNIADTLNRISSVFRQEEQWIEELTIPWIEKTVSLISDSRLSVDLSVFRPMHSALKRRILRKAVKLVKGDLRRITLHHIDDIIRAASGHRAECHLDLPDNLSVCVRKNAILICRGKSVLPIAEALLPFSIEIDLENIYSKIVEIPGRGMAVRFSEILPAQLPNVLQTGKDVALFDMEKIDFPLTIRSIQPGDRFSPLGINGTQKLKKFFINNKIDRKMRAKVPVMLCKNHIIWVMRHRIDNRVRVTPETRKILKAQIFLPNQPE